MPSDKKITFTALMPTLGRTKELQECLNSIIDCKRPEFLIRVLLVDQNETGFLDKFIPEDYCINHIHSVIKGLSRNRNIAMRYLTTSDDYVLFLDDDNILDKDFFHFLHEEITRKAQRFYVVSALQIEDGRNYTYPLRNDKSLFGWKSWKSVISWNIVMSYDLTQEVGLFDERFGVGEFWGACEESDYTLRALRKCGKFYYLPLAKVFHKSRSKNYDNLKRSRSYARGFGAFLRKQQTLDVEHTIYWKYQFYKLLALNLIALILYFFTSRRSHYLSALVGKTEGYFGYESSI